MVGIRRAPQLIGDTFITLPPHRIHWEKKAHLNYIFVAFASATLQVLAAIQFDF